MDNKKKWDLISLASIPLVMTLGNSMLIPVLPLIEKKLGITSFEVSMIITVYSIAAILLIPIAGYLSDRYGRKKVIIPSLFIAGAGGLVTGWASWSLEDPYSMILIGRVLQGIGSSGAAPVVLPLVGDLFKSDKDVSAGLGLIETSNTIGKVLSPILGALLASFLWYLPFLAIPVFSLISILLVIFLVESPEKNEKPQTFSCFLSCLKNIFHNDGKWLTAIFAIGGIIMFVLFGILFYLAGFLEKEFQIVGVKKGAIIAIPLVALSLTSYIAGKRIGENKTTMKWCIFAGLSLLAAATIGVSFTEILWFMLLILFVAGIGIGMSLPCLDALITEGVKKEERGTITSLYSSTRFLGVAAGPPIYAILMKQSHEIVFYTSAAVAVAAILLCFVSIKPEADV
ncbi:MFS transporter [Pseudalkalibacillus hwajinpoensis]|uniref:MFS transporter n=1 Tax=Guptibacillus hwajinpoensis TaxID=208199 RepID=UPI001CD1FD3D|nr:MFS transporter [Pseudalkalibacillus hwajinpoensis]MCA0992218.1 MFS transporter [Pseudalkalibacillus hwajinpoensis]